MGSAGRLAGLAGLLLACARCAPSVSSPPLPTEREWLASRTWLEELRATAPSQPFGATVRVALREPRTRRTFTARGAVAVDPHRAIRLILLGPGGATALDVWATKERWRFEVPAANVLRRGGREEDLAVPIGFFRWWFLSPVEGRLLTSVGGATGDRERFVLRAREGGATVDLTDARGPGGHVLVASRLAHGALDRVELRGASLAFAPGDRAVYDQDPSGVHVEVTIEARSDAPDPAAFLDPDSPVADTGPS